MESFRKWRRSYVLPSNVLHVLWLRGDNIISHANSESFPDRNVPEEIIRLICKKLREIVHELAYSKTQFPIAVNAPIV
jgi:hypothetical protein